MSYSRVIDTLGVDVTLFSGGNQGVLFTASEQNGLTIKIAPSSGGSITTSGILTGSGLSLNDSLVVNGAGHLILSMWGELNDYYRIVNTDQLEVIVGSPVIFNRFGTVGGISVTSDAAGFWIPAGVYSDHDYSISGSGVVTWS